MSHTAGIDVGACSVKVAVVAHGDGGPQPLALVTERFRKRDMRAVVRGCFERTLEKAGVAETDLTYVASTGFGELVDFRTGHFYGMTSHARGAHHLDPEARAVLDVGALHARAIRIDPRARVLAYKMTAQCASGSGQFIENIARYLGVPLAEVGPLSLSAGEPERLSGICAVLAETDVINMVGRGVPAAAILKGIHHSVANRLVKLLAGVKAESPVLVTGGLARDSGLVGAIRTLAPGAGLDIDVRVHPDSAAAGALGAALWAEERLRQLAS